MSFLMTLTEWKPSESEGGLGLGLGFYLRKWNLDNPGSAPKISLEVLLCRVIQKDGNPCLGSRKSSSLLIGAWEAVPVPFTQGHFIFENTQETRFWDKQDSSLLSYYFKSHAHNLKPNHSSFHWHTNTVILRVSVSSTRRCWLMFWE